jgi:hypothetical protein
MGITGYYGIVVEIPKKHRLMPENPNNILGTA